MCIIVDASAAHHVLGPTDAGKPVARWLLGNRSAKLVLGGSEFVKETVKAGLGAIVQELGRAGRLCRVDNDIVQDIASHVKPKCKSNDCHVVALAIVSKCDVVFTLDKDLHADLKNGDICGLSVKIYQDAAHAHLLGQCRCQPRIGQISNKPQRGAPRSKP